jgi:hypothetical protein
MALAVLGTGVVLAAAAPTDSGQIASCGATFQLHDPALKQQFAALDRGRSADFAELCTAYRSDRATRRAAVAG